MYIYFYITYFFIYIYNIFIAFLTHVSSVLITFVTLAVFISIEGDNNVEFTASKVFAALALFNQLTVPLFIFPITVPIIIAAIVSTRRLEQFLAEQEVQREFEGIRNMARILSRSDASLDVYENENIMTAIKNCRIDTEEMSQTISINEDSLSSVATTIATSIATATPTPTPTVTPTPTPTPTPTATLQATTINEHFVNAEINLKTLANEKLKYNSMKNSRIKLIKNNQISVSTRLERIRSKQKSLSKEYQIQISPDLVVSVRNGTFTWERSVGDLYLTVNKLDIPMGKLTVIVGRSGSGKTSLLAALLKEMQKTCGSLVWNK